MSEFKLTTVEEFEAATARLLETGAKVGADAWQMRVKNQTPHCKFGEQGVCCRICSMGPCRITPKASRGICGCDQPAGPRFAGEKRGRHRLQALRAAYRQPYAYRPVSVGNPLRRIANARRVPGTGNGFYRDDETGGIGAAGAFRLLSGMRVICSTLYKETAPGYFRPERESVRFGIFSSFFAGSCWNKADCFRIFV